MPDINPHTDTQHRNRVVIVEDDPFIGSVLLREIQRFNPNTTLIASGSDAAEILPKDIPDLLLLDIFLPGMNGLDLLESLRKEPGAAALRVLVVSNTDQAKDRDRALKLGADFVFKVASSPPEIAEMVQKLLSE